MGIYELAGFLNLFPPIVAVIGLCIGLYYYKSLNIVDKCITLYLLVMLVVDQVSRYVGDTGNNLIVLVFYSLLEMTLFTWFYFRYLFKAKHKLILGLYIVSVIYIIWEIVIFEREIKGYQSYAKVVDDFIIIILAFTFFHEKINIFKESKWDNFRLNAVILAFFSLNISLFLPLNFIINDSFGFYFWFGNSLSLILFYSYLTHSIWKNGRTQKLLLSGLR